MADKKRVEPEEDDKCTHPLICAEEWEDSEGAKVIAEFHKDGGPDEERRVEEDLDAFERYWQKKQGINFQGEYHKEGAPFLEEPSGWDGHRPRSQEAVGEALPATQPSLATVFEEEEKPENLAAREASEPAILTDAGIVKGEATLAPSPPLEHGKEPKEPLKLTEVVDINTLEVISYWIFRVAFGKELHIPIKKEGLADIDVHIKNKEVIVNTNQLYFAFPELVVWHITYTHKGRPILEIGRGVKKGMKVHRLNAVRLLMEVWMGSRKAEKAPKKTGKGASAPIQGGSKSQKAKDNQDLKEKGDIT
jgi:hypothetical protein